MANNWFVKPEIIYHSGIYPEFKSRKTYPGTQLFAKARTYDLDFVMIADIEEVEKFKKGLNTDGERFYEFYDESQIIHVLNFSGGRYMCRINIPKDATIYAGKNSFFTDQIILKEFYHPAIFYYHEKLSKVGKKILSDKLIPKKNYKSMEEFVKEYYKDNLSTSDDILEIEDFEKNIFQKN